MRRFVQAFVPDALPPALGADVVAALAAAPERYNIAARDDALVILDRGEGLVAHDMQWTLVPSWSRTRDIRYTTVTARLERAAESKVYSRAWKSRRCAVPMTGYYKWDRTVKPARPYFIQPADGSLLLAAGLWDRWPADEPELHSFTVLTAPNAAIPAPLVADGPVFLDAEHAIKWIDGPLLPTRFLERARQPALEAYAVSRRVGKRNVDDYTLLEPVDPRELADADAGDQVDDDV